MAVKVKVEGLREVQKALRELPKKSTRRNTLKRVAFRRLEPVARAMRGNVPIEQGFLQESIDVSTKLSRAQKREHRKQDDVEVFVGPGPDPAAHLQEFGSSQHPAQPFARPAWDREKRGVLRGIENDLWAEIQTAAERAARKAARAGRRRRR